jgi:hypothetical protein
MNTKKQKINVSLSPKALGAMDRIGLSRLLKRKTLADALLRKIFEDPKAEEIVSQLLDNPKK